MYNYLRPIDDRFQINNVSMPRPHSFKTKKQDYTKDAERDINTGEIIINKICTIAETTWKYNLIRDDQFRLIIDTLFDENILANIPFKSLDSLRPNSDGTFETIEYKTYRQSDFESPNSTNIQADGHRYFKDVEFKFTNMGGDI